LLVGRAFVDGREVVGQLADLVREARASVPPPVSYAVFRPAVESFTVERDDSGDYVVVGRDAERAGALNDLSNPEALAVVPERLKRLGVDKALAKAGASDGDIVHIGAFSFEYQD
jgi:GTP-binding protein